MAGTIAMAKAGAVKHNHPVILGGKINQSAGLKIFDHAPIAVQHDQGPSCSPIDVVEPNAIDGNESTDRGIAILSFFCKPPIQKDRCRRGQGEARRDRNSLPRNIAWLRRARLAFGDNVPNLSHFRE
jgi:hypothetical protein